MKNVTVQDYSLKPNFTQSYINSDTRSVPEIVDDNFEKGLIDEDQLQRAIDQYATILEKGGQRAAIGEIRKFGGREYIKTAQGWKFHGKGTGVKAQEHKAASGEQKKEQEGGREEDYDKYFKQHPSLKQYHDSYNQDPWKKISKEKIDAKYPHLTEQQKRTHAILATANHSTFSQFDLRMHSKKLSDKQQQNKKQKPTMSVDDAKSLSSKQYQEQMNKEQATKDPQYQHGGPKDKPVVNEEAKAKAKVKDLTSLKKYLNEWVPGFDNVIHSKTDDTLKLRQAFFYRHGGSAEKFKTSVENTMKKLGFPVKVVDAHENWQAWPKTSYWEAQVKWDNK